MDPTMTKEIKIEVQWNEIRDMPYVFTPMADYTYQREEHLRKYTLTVYVQGNIQQQGEDEGLEGIKNKLVILTVHDMGTNPPNSFIEFVNSPSMADFRKEKSQVAFLHVCIPGQEPGAMESMQNFPTMDELAQILPQVLEHFGIKRCIAMGEGAGADVVYRFATFNPEMVSGVMLVHCTSSTHGFVENLKEMIANLRIEEGKMSESAWDYLMAHKLGQKPTAESKAHFIEGIRQLGLNEHNLSQYLHAFASRDELEIFRPSKFRCILATGGLSPHNKNIFHMFEHMDKEKSGLIVAEGVVDILREGPEYIGMALEDLFHHNHNDSGTPIQMPKIEVKEKELLCLPKPASLSGSNSKDSVSQTGKFQCSHCRCAVSPFKNICSWCEDSHCRNGSEKRKI